MQDDPLWACLAGMAAAHKELSTAEIAYAAIDEVSIHGTLRCNIVMRQYCYICSLFASGYSCCSLFPELICNAVVSLEEALNLLSLMTSAHIGSFCRCLYI